jgi:hypothetical protein
MKKYLDTNNDSFAVQASKFNLASPADVSEFTEQLIGKTANSGSLGYEITYTIGGNQSEVKHWGCGS